VAHGEASAARGKASGACGRVSAAHGKVSGACGMASAAHGKASTFRGKVSPVPEGLPRLTERSPQLAERLPRLTESLRVSRKGLPGSRKGPLPCPPPLRGRGSPAGVPPISPDKPAGTPAVPGEMLPSESQPRGLARFRAILKFSEPFSAAQNRSEELQRRSQALRMTSRDFKIILRSSEWLQ
jgi:hypothetical protein